MAQTFGGALVLVCSLMPACRQDSREGPPSATTARHVASRQDVLSTGEKLTGRPLYSQANEELIIRHFFRDRRNGFFLDVGCASPIVNSNTYYLERHLGWSGIAVDALPEFGPAWRRKRPRSRFFNHLVTDHSDTLQSFYRRELRGISSSRQDTTKGPGGREVKLEEIRVPTITLTKLLEQNGVSRIDFLSMDIEGGELLALAGLDIARYRPELACVEAKPANREQLLEYFDAHGYQRLDRYVEYDRVNYYFTPKLNGR